MVPEANNNTITIDRDDYFRLVTLSERRRQAIAEAFTVIDRLKKLDIKIDFRKKPKSMDLMREFGSLISDSKKQQAIAAALGKFTNCEYLDELKTLSQDE